MFAAFNWKAERKNYVQLKGGERDVRKQGGKLNLAIFL